MAVAACSSAASPSPTAAPTSATTAGPSSAASPDAAAQIAALKAKLQGTPKLIIGSSSFPNSSMTTSYKMVALLKSDFGLDVDYRVMDSNPLIAAMISGQVQVGGLSLAGVANANGAGADFQAFGTDDQKNTFLVAAKKPITTMAALKGKPFGVTSNLNQITGQTAQKCFSLAGMDLQKDTQLVKFNNTGETMSALRSGQVVGTLSATFRLAVPTLQDGDIYSVLCKGWEANPQISTVWMANRSWVTANKNVALAINIAELEASRWAKTNKDAWVALDVASVPNTIAEAAAVDYQAMVVTIDDWPVNGGLDQAMCDSTLKTSLEFNAITKPYACADLVTFDYQNQALAILGKQ